MYVLVGSGIGRGIGRGIGGGIGGCDGGSNASAECPLTSIPPLKRRRLDAIVGVRFLNGSDLNIIARILCGAPG